MWYYDSYVFKIKASKALRNNSGTTLVEFALVGGLFIGMMLSVIEMMLLRLYITTVETAITKGLEDTAFNTTLITNDGLITSHDRLRHQTNILDEQTVRDNIPTFYEMFVGSNINLEIETDRNTHDDFNASGGMALSAHKSYRVSLTADWDPFSLICTSQQHQLIIIWS